jgi:hypothetical protein
MFQTGRLNKRRSTVVDVRIVYANCHHIIHLTKDPLDVDVLEQRIEGFWSRWTDAGISQKPAPEKPTRPR